MKRCEGWNEGERKAAGMGGGGAHGIRGGRRTGGGHGGAREGVWGWVSLVLKVGARGMEDGERAEERRCKGGVGRVKLGCRGARIGGLEKLWFGQSVLHSTSNPYVNDDFQFRIRTRLL